jgi:hypothetical protein
VRIFAPCEKHIGMDSEDWIEKNPKEWNRVIWEGMVAERLRMRDSFVPEGQFVRRYGVKDKNVRKKTTTGQELLEEIGRGLSVEVALRGTDMPARSLVSASSPSATPDSIGSIKKPSSVSKVNHRLPGETLIGLKETPPFGGTVF